MAHVLVQPYMAYKGHFSRYTSNLREAFDTVIFSSLADNLDNGSLDVPSSANWKAFLRWKVLHALNAYRRIPYRSSVLHIVDFEPVAAIIALPRLASAKKLIVTLHAVTAAVSKRGTMGVAAHAHKVLTLAMLRLLLLTRRAQIVVHYENQRKTLLEAGFTATQVQTIPYPITWFDTHVDKLTKGSLLVFGSLRLDKDPLNILRAVARSGLRVTVAGRVDPVLMQDVGKFGFKIIDRHVSEEELTELFSEAEYVLLPYGPQYSGGAGPMKDAIGGGRPVIAPDYPLFREIVSDAGVGLLFVHPEDIQTLLQGVSLPMYERMLENTEKYRMTYTWSYMREAYKRIYAS
jgi:glycosyltransferase involved in cell wall biosynthesis